MSNFELCLSGEACLPPVREKATAPMNDHDRRNTSTGSQRFHAYDRIRSTP